MKTTTKPTKIHDGEWWYHGNIIQKNDDPRLPRYVVFRDLDHNQKTIGTAHTFNEAKHLAKMNPTKTSHSAEVYLK